MNALPGSSKSSNVKTVLQPEVGCYFGLTEKQENREQAVLFFSENTNADRVWFGVAILFSDRPQALMQLCAESSLWYLFQMFCCSYLSIHVNWYQVQKMPKLYLRTCESGGWATELRNLSVRCPYMHMSFLYMLYRVLYLRILWWCWWWFQIQAIPESNEILYSSGKFFGPFTGRSMKFFNELFWEYSGIPFSKFYELLRKSYEQFWEVFWTSSDFLEKFDELYQLLKVILWTASRTCYVPLDFSGSQESRFSGLCFGTETLFESFSFRIHWCH